MPFLSVLEAQTHRTSPMKWPFEPLIRGNVLVIAEQTALWESSSVAFEAIMMINGVPERGA